MRNHSGHQPGMTHWPLVAPPVPPLTWPVRRDLTGTSGPTPGAARGENWRRTTSGCYVPSSVSEDVVEQRILEQYAGAGDHAVVTGWAALRLRRAAFFDGLDRDGRTLLPVPLASNGGERRPSPTYQRVRLTVPPDEVVLVHGMRCATVERALFDEMRRCREVREMSVAADMAFAVGLTGLARMQQYAWERRWYRDVRSVREALTMSVETSRSPQESRMRHVWEYDAGWGRPLCNVDVVDERGRFVARPDLLDPVRGVAGEYAGADHRDAHQHASDVSRLADVLRVGLQVVEVTGRDLRAPHVVVRRMQEAEQRARASVLPRLWMLRGGSALLPSSGADGLRIRPWEDPSAPLDGKRAGGVSQAGAPPTTP